MDARLEAAAMADGVLEALDQPVAQADVPSVRAVIIECAMFENPMPDLKVAVHQVGSYYNVTVSGYRNLLDLVRWVNVFVGNHRGIHMSNVTHTYLQQSDTTFYIVIQIQRVELHVAPATVAAGAAHHGAGRTISKQSYSSRVPLVKRVE